MPAHKILVVEDSPTARRATVDMLEGAGYEVITATDGEEALARAAEHQPHAVVLDIVLPKKNGYQVCRRLKEDKSSRTPVLMLTAKDQERDRIWGQKQGADAYLAKPVNREELIRSIDELLSISASQ